MQIDWFIIEFIYSLCHTLALQIHDDKFYLRLLVFLMVHKCVVHFCNDNCKTIHEIATFDFSRDEGLKMKYITVLD